MANVNNGRSYLFTFPFWIIVDSTSEFEIAELNKNGNLVRVYPFFRSGVANYIPTPVVDVHNIPFKKGTKPNITPGFRLKVLTQYPTLKFDALGKTELNLQWDDAWQNPTQIFQWTA